MEQVDSVVLVDAYGPTKRLAPEFRRAGCRCVRVQSTPEVPEVYRAAPFVAEDFVDDIVHDGDLDATLEKVARHRPTAIIAAGESGVEFADLLSETLGTPSNGTRMSAARRDKFAMVEAIRKAGLAGARQLLITDEDELRAWHDAMGSRIVLKPLRGAASVGVTYCENSAESVQAYRLLRDTESVFSEPSVGVVAQEYLQGAEYMVNTVSRDGLHYVCDIWKTTKVALNGMPDLVDGIYLTRRRGEVQDLLAAYCFQVLDALEIRHGAAHLEVKMTPAGPCLVEVGARIAGADLPYYARLAIGESQIDRLVDAYVRPGEFRSRHREEYSLRQFFATVPMLSPYDGILKSYRGIDEIKGLESFREVLQVVRPGDRLRRTVNDVTIPLAVNLMHDLEEAVYRDSRTVRQLDGAGFYELDGAV